MILSTFISCDDKDDWIPNVRVDKWMDLNTELATLGLLQARVIPEEGVNGILLFRLQDREFNAFDRTCSFQPSKHCAVEFDETELKASCPCCGSEFELFYSGGVQKGPAKRPLKQYQTTIQGNMLRITNF